MKAAIYAREEKFRRADDLDDQIQFCREFAQAKKLFVSDNNIYEDLGIIDSLDNDSGLRQLMQACRAGVVQAVIVEQDSVLADGLKFYDEIRQELDKMNIEYLVLAHFPGFDRWVEDQDSN